jgi:hypothetical protein
MVEIQEVVLAADENVYWVPSRVAVDDGYGVAAIRGVRRPAQVPPDPPEVPSVPRVALK